jgi:MinD-like ATPase involved in chromosome partitioning or flagellar assembly
MSSAEPTVALVFSPEQWVEDLHRHLAHHGGARVRQIVVEPAVALDEAYDALVVSDRWPALTLGFVGAVHDRGRRVLGVFDPDEPAGRDHLLALGVDVTIASDSAMAEFVNVLSGLHSGTPQGSEPVAASRRATVDRDPADGVLAVVSGPRGSGVTEVALGLAGALAARPTPVVLVDAHETAPGVAGRLGLGLEPNVRSAIDACAHGLGTLDDAIVGLAAPAPRALGVVAGFPSPVAAAQVTPRDVLDVAHILRRGDRSVVVDTDESSSTARALLGVATAVVGVATASPVGVVRALEWVAELERTAPGVPLHLAVNRAPSSRYRQAQIRTEILRTVAPASLTWIPHDRAVDAAAWDGAPVARGGFRSAVERLARAVCPAPARRRRSR